MSTSTNFRSVSAGPVRGEAGTFKLAGEVVGLLAIVVLVHALVLRFVFPGFYAPTLFEHSDFYIPVALRYSNLGIFSMLGWGRPIGMVYLYSTGWLGIDGSILATLGVIFANMILMAMIIRRVCNLELDWKFIAAFAIFSFCMFSHPYFFTMAVHDALAQLSFLFLAIGIVIFLAMPSLSLVGLLALFVLMGLAFLSKENFALSAFWVLGVIGLGRRRSSVVAAIVPVTATIAAFLAAIAYNLHVKSGFISGTSDAGGAYKQTHNITVIFDQIVKYIKAGMPNYILLTFLILYIILMICSPRSIKIIICSLVFAGLLALIPNSTLPNHFFPGYSWNMGYFLFAPILVLPVIFRRLGNLYGASLGLAAGALLLTVLPYFWTPAYATNDWTMQQAAIQQNIRQSLDVLTRSASLGSDNRRVLVTGLDVPFSPFDQGEAIREWIGNSNARLDVVSYVGHPAVSAPVHFLAPADVRLEDYGDIWAFAPDGTGKEIASYAHLPELSFLGRREMILYPSILDVLGVSHFASPQVPPSATQYLMMGVRLTTYRAYNLAIAAFDQSIALLPSNPYAYFYEALAFDALGRRDEALVAARQAVATDASSSPNPYFAPLVERLQHDRADKH